MLCHIRVAFQGPDGSMVHWGAEYGQRAQGKERNLEPDPNHWENDITSLESPPIFSFPQSWPLLGHSAATLFQTHGSSFLYFFHH